MTSATGLAAHPPCPPQAGRAAAALAIALAGAFLLVGTATARPLRKGDGPSHAPSFARSCTIAAPETKPLFESKAEPASADDDDADADDNEDDKTAGVILPGSATCLSLSGTVSAGLQYDAYRVPQSGPAPPPNAFSFQTSGSLRIAASHDLASGLRIASAFEFTMRTPAEDGDTVSIDEATIQVGPWTFGLDSSRFNFWTGDEFIFSTRVPDRTVGVIALELPLTATLGGDLRGRGSRGRLDHEPAEPGRTSRPGRGRASGLYIGLLGASRRACPSRHPRAADTPGQSRHSRRHL
jgi:hypothetical protein